MPCPAGFYCPPGVAGPMICPQVHACLPASLPPPPPPPPFCPPARCAACVEATYHPPPDAGSDAYGRRVRVVGRGRGWGRGWGRLSPIHPYSGSRIPCSGPQGWGRLPHPRKSVPSKLSCVRVACVCCVCVLLVLVVGACCLCVARRASGAQLGAPRAFCAVRGSTEWPSAPPPTRAQARVQQAFSVHRARTPLSCLPFCAGLARTRTLVPRSARRAP
jgi:hypothetical protein